MISKFFATVRSKVLFLVTMVLIVAFTFFISYLLNKAISFEDTKYFGDFFWWVRGIAAALLLICSVYVVLSRKDGVSKFYLLYATAGLQLVPLIIRFIGLIDNEKTATEVSIVVLFLVMIPYLIFCFYLTMAADKIKRMRKETKATVVKAVKEESFYDENGNFVGDKKK